MGMIEHLRKRGIKDLFKTKKRNVFFRAKKENFTGIKLKVDEVDSYAKQYVYRASLCPECVVKKSCVGCGCPTEELFRTKTAVCGFLNEDKENEPRWVEMKDPEEWKDFENKFLTGLEFGLKQIDSGSK